MLVGMQASVSRTQTSVSRKYRGASGKQISVYRKQAGVPRKHRGGEPAPRGIGRNDVGQDTDLNLFRGLVVKAHRLLYHSTLGSRVIK